MTRRTARAEIPRRRARPEMPRRRARAEIPRRRARARIRRGQAREAARRAILRALIPLLAASVLGCATTSTKRIRLDPAEVAAEEARQRQLVLADAVEQQRRLTDVAFPIVRAATPLCPEDVGLRSGLLVSNAWEYDGAWRSAAVRALGLDDVLQIIAVARGSAAERAGLRPGDRLLALDGRPLATGGNAIEAFAERVEAAARGPDARYRLTLERGAETLLTEVELEEQCAYPVLIVPDADVQALADGRRILVTSGMMRFADDHELAVVVGHELAHNAMGHIDARRHNAILGGILGAVLDVAATAATGYSTGGVYTSEGLRIGAEAFSQDFEIEADYVGLYALGLAGIALEGAPDLWRHMAMANPASIGFARTHPTTAERFLRLDRTASEIRLKRARGLALRPDPKGAADLDDRALYAEAGGAGEEPAVRRPATGDATLNVAPLRQRRAEAEPRWGDRYWGREAPPRFETVPPTRGWTRHREWIGDGSSRTESFTVGSEWKIVWRSGDRPASEPLGIEAFELPGDVLVASVTQDGESKTSSLQLHGPGTYYLRIRGGGGVWYVGIEVPSER